MTEQDYKAKQQKFKAMPPEEKEKFINEQLLSGKSNDEIAKEEFARSGSWIRDVMLEVGYTKQRNGLYVKDEPKNENENEGSVVELNEKVYTAMLELAEYKDALLALVNGRTVAEKPDFSLLDRYEGENTVSRTYALPKPLVDDLDELSKRFRVKKQDLFLVALASFVENYK